MSKLDLTPELSDKEIPEITTYLEENFGYKVQNFTSKDGLIAIANQLHSHKVSEGHNRFVLFQHLSEYLDLTERMLTNALYSSVATFASKHINTKGCLLGKKEEIYFQVRDIIISNSVKVLKPSNLPKREKARDVVPSGMKRVFLKKPNVKASGITKVKEPRINKIIDTLIDEDGLDLFTEIKPKMIMDAYSRLHNDTVSDGYVYGVITRRKNRDK
mgnify:CR=1 FL=1